MSDPERDDQDAPGWPPEHQLFGCWDRCSVLFHHSGDPSAVRLVVDSATEGQGPTVLPVQGETCKNGNRRDQSEQGAIHQAMESPEERSVVQPVRGQ